MSEKPGSELLIVAIGPRRYAIAVEFVREVIPMLEPTPVPTWPETALGLFQLRGEFLPLLDVAPALGHPPTAIDPEKRVVILEFGARLCGAIVSAVDGVRELPVQISAALADAGLLPPSPLVRAVALDERGPVTVLDPAALAEAAGLPNVSAESAER